MTKTMKAARLFGPDDLRVINMPIPELGPRDILSKVMRAGICGTDYSIYSGEFSFVKDGSVKFPFTPGHEWSGVVAAVGSEVVSFKPGDRIVGDTFVSCGSCDVCLMGLYDHCKNVRSVGTINAWDGGFAEYTVFPERHIFHLPDGVSFDAGAFVEPAATSLNAVNAASVEVGDTVLVHGSGPLGVLAAKFAKLSGASKVFITGRKDPKLQVALSYGADVAINTTRESVADAVARHTAQGRVRPDHRDLGIARTSAAVAGSGAQGRHACGGGVLRQADRKSGNRQTRVRADPSRGGIGEHGYLRTRHCADGLGRA